MESKTREIPDAGLGSAAYCRLHGRRGVWGLSLQLIFVEYPIFASNSVSGHEGHGANYLVQRPAYGAHATLQRWRGRACPSQYACFRMFEIFNTYSGDMMGK